MSLIVQLFDRMRIHVTYCKIFLTERAFVSMILSIGVFMSLSVKYFSLNVHSCHLLYNVSDNTCIHFTYCKIFLTVCAFMSLIVQGL